jgi:DNA-binding transcriptional LysR family regulator
MLITGDGWMEIRQLEYALVVSKHLNLARAAEEIKISPSILSQQISKLEIELGVCLFLKGKRLVRLTPAGKEFIINAKRIITNLKEVKCTGKEYSPVVNGELRLGVMAVIGYYNLPNLLSSFQQSFIGMRINIVEEQCEKLLDMLLSDKIDAAFVQIYNPNPNLKYCKLVTDRMVIVTNKKHRFANRKSVDIKELKNERFILTPPSSGHFYDFNKACQAAGFSPILAKTCYVAKNIVSFVSEEPVITAISSKVAEAEKADNDNISIIELKPTIQRKIFLVVRNISDTPQTLKLFLDFTYQWLTTQTALEQAKNALISSVLEK